MFWGCLSAGTASGSIVHQQSCLLQKAPPGLFLRLSPLEARRVGAPRRVGARASRRRTERRGSTAQRAIPPPLLDLGHRPVGWGTRRHLRRHAVVRRESPRCQTSCAPDGHAWGVVAPRGVPARGGCGGGLVGSQEDCALLASWPGPLWRPEAAMRLLWRDWRQALPASGTAWVVRRVLRASCVYGVVAERRFTFANTWFLLVQPAPTTLGAEDLGAGCTLGAICAVAHDH